MVRANRLLLGSILCSGLLAVSASAEEIEKNTAQMQAMDKITGRVSVIDVPVNGEVRFGSFSIVVRACKTTPPEETPENYAFVDVADSSFGKMQFNIFKGWMMSSSPALNAVEHPIYDVWLLKCHDTKVEASALLSPEALQDRDALPKLEDIKRDDDNEKKTPETIGKTPEDSAPALPQESNPEESAAAEQAEPGVQPADEPTSSPDAAAENKPDDGAPQSLINIQVIEAEKAAEAKKAAQPEIIPSQAGETSKASSALPPVPQIPGVTTETDMQPVVMEKEVIEEDGSTPSETSQNQAAAETEPVKAPESGNTLVPPVSSRSENTEIVEEEDQFIDFSGEADSLKDLEAELSAEALKDE